MFVLVLQAALCLTHQNSMNLLVRFLSSMFGHYSVFALLFPVGEKVKTSPPEAPLLIKPVLFFLSSSVWLLRNAIQQHYPKITKKI